MAALPAEPSPPLRSADSPSGHAGSPPRAAPPSHGPRRPRPPGGETCPSSSVTRAAGRRRRRCTRAGASTLIRPADGSPRATRERGSPACSPGSPSERSAISANRSAGRMTRVCPRRARRFSVVHQDLFDPRCAARYHPLGPRSATVGRGEGDGRERRRSRRQLGVEPIGSISNGSSPALFKARARVAPAMPAPAMITSASRFEACRGYAAKARPRHPRSLNFAAR